MKTSELLTTGKVYSRADLRKMFSIVDATINTGIFQPRGHDSIWLFITEKKTSDRQQYKDHLSGDVLEWDGQTSGRKDDAIIGHHKNGIELLVFYRREIYEFPGAGFRYEGQFKYISHQKGFPSHFQLRRAVRDSETRDGSIQHVTGKACRICWNTLNWRSPSGDARHFETGDSFASKYGFGHEEWLFNLEWTLSGYQRGDQTEYRYGFIQPINRYLKKYQGKTFKIFLYTVSPERQAVAVARIDTAYIPEDGEMKWASNKIRSKGWLKIMRDELRDLGITGSTLDTSYPWAITNVRFQPKDIHFYDPRPTLKIKNFRYIPFDWDEADSKFFEKIPNNTRRGGPKGKFKKRSEAMRARPASGGTQYDPRHAQLQNALFDFLIKRYGDENVEGEKNYVDLSYRDKGVKTFIEIKMELTVRQCVRLALGQLLEYSHYPNLTNADRLLVVGDREPTNDDNLYLSHVRKLYGLPLYYSKWNGKASRLEAEI